MAARFSRQFTREPVSAILARKSAGAGVPNLRNKNLGQSEQRKQLDLIQSMNRDLLARKKVNNQIEGVIESYELAFRMQSAVPDTLDMSQESQKNT